VRILTATAAAALIVWASALALPAVAQTNPGESAFQNQFPDPLNYKPPVPDPPEFRIVSVEQIPLAGPLESGPRLVDGMIEVRTAAGLVRTTWDGSAQPTIDATPAAPDQPAREWGVSSDGTHRAGALDYRTLLVQKSCRSCDSGWRRRWRMRVAGLAQAAPLVTEQRVYYGAADNKVYGVRRKNGHRAWATALDGRIQRPLALWVADDASIAALLAIPEPGVELVVLDAVGGRAAFRYTLQGADEHFVGPAVRVPDGRIVLARQGYAPGDAGLVVLEITFQAPDTAEPVEIPVTGYNLPASDEPIPARPLPDIRTTFATAGSLSL
jgi:hypothetical protein